MKPENQVSSLEPSKKLKELGVKQESSFVYQNIKHEGSRKITQELELVEDWDYFDSPNGYVSALTIPEFGLILRGHADALRNYWKTLPAVGEEEQLKNLTDPDWWASCLIYLLENKLITL